MAIPLRRIAPLVALLALAPPSRAPAQALVPERLDSLKKATGEADNCNTSKQPCTMGKLAKMTIVPVRPAEAEVHKKLVEGAVLAGFAKRCGAECAAEWNDTVGKALNLRAPAP